VSHHPPRMHASTAMYLAFALTKCPERWHPMPLSLQASQIAKQKWRQGAMFEDVLHPMHCALDVVIGMGGEGKVPGVKSLFMRRTSDRRFSSLKLSLKAVAPMPLDRLLLASFDGWLHLHWYVTKQMLVFLHGSTDVLICRSVLASLERCCDRLHEFDCQ
jgi:hypothetical protein